MGVCVCVFWWWWGGANAHQQLRAIIITASSDNIITDNQVANQRQFANYHYNSDGGWQHSRRLQQLNYPDEGVVETTPATLPATYETNGRLQTTPGDTWGSGSCEQVSN